MKCFLASFAASLWLLAAPALAALGTPVSLGTGNTAATVSASVVITTLVDAPAGSTIYVASGVMTGAGTPATIVDSALNTYTLSGTCSTLNSQRMCGWYTVLGSQLNAGSLITITWSTATGEKFAAAASVTGTAPSSVVDQHATASNTARPVTVTTGTLSQANEIAFAFLQVVNPVVTFTESTSNAFTSISNVAGTGGRKAWFSYRITSATTAVTWAPTISADQTWTALLDTLKEASSGSTVKNRLLRGVGP